MLEKWPGAKPLALRILTSRRLATTNDHEYRLFCPRLWKIDKNPSDTASCFDYAKSLFLLVIVR